MTMTEDWTAEMQIGTKGKGGKTVPIVSQLLNFKVCVRWTTIELPNGTLPKVQK